METNSNPLRAYRVFPPGSTMQDELEARGLSAADLAQALGLSASELEALLVGELPLTETMAQRLEDFWGISAGFWLHLEASYRQRIAEEARQAS